MIDRTVTLASGSEDEERFQNTLRPRGLAEFIGQESEKRRLAIAIQAAKMRGEPLEHVLLSGPPGLGKTTLSVIVSHEMGGNLVSTSGAALEKTAVLMVLLLKLE